MRSRTRGVVIMAGKPRRLAGLLAVALGACGGISEVRDPQLDALYRRGKEALTANRFQQSIQLLERVAADRPQDIELLYWLGVAHWKREQAAGAIRAYRRAVELDPEGSSPWSLYALENLAEVYGRTDRLEMSKESYQRALARETRPEWIEKIATQIAELDLALGIYARDEATVVNERGEIVGGVGPGRMRTNRNFEIARHTQDPKKEARYYRLAIDTDPRMYQSYFNLGLALVHQGRYNDAIPWLEESDAVWKEDSASNPNHLDKVDAQAFLALCHLELGRIGRARVHADRAVAIDSSYFWAVLYAQRVRVARGRAEEALRHRPLLAAPLGQLGDERERGHDLDGALALDAVRERVP